MRTTTTPHASGKSEDHTTAREGATNTSSDRLIDFREVNRLVSSGCKTSHYARVLAKRGQIRAVRLNARVLLYSESSVRDLISGRVAQ